ncbi:MAG: 50S ribosomal L17 [Lasallia pustulata]|uniref:Large ribosomal subunit protein bL17m n=1 Tax=Lasallia pustulata TaxID=136370 RepID=A0A5M8PPI2_9LECA|nr:MAG: 50S ribosomal L17 [Lasallia pustulata]
MAGGALKYRHLGRKSSHRVALLRNLVTSLIEHESISTTWPKAKEAQRLAERLITLAKRNTATARQAAAATLFNPAAHLPKLFSTLRDRYAARPGGYTRVLRIEPLKPDSAPSAILELVDGPRDMRFAMTAKTLARERAGEGGVREVTARNRLTVGLFAAVSVFVGRIFVIFNTTLSPLPHINARRISEATARSSDLLTKEFSKSYPNLTLKIQPRHTSTSSIAALYDSIIYLHVGPEKVKFGIHKGLLCRYSRYFSAALNGSFKEAQTGIVDLADETIPVIRMFNLWLYTQKIVGRDSSEDVIKCQDLIDLYIFAEKRVIPKLQDAAILALLKQMQTREKIPIAYVTRIWENTAEKSGLRRLFVDAAAHMVDLVVVFEDPRYRKLPKAFLADVLVAVAKGNELPKKRWSYLRACDYHVHPDDEKCDVADKGTQT